MYGTLLFIFSIGLELISKVDPNPGQLTPFIKLLNVMTCDSEGPAIAFKLNISTNAFIILYPDGSSETEGGISVRPLSCNDNHTQ